MHVLRLAALFLFVGGAAHASGQNEVNAGQSLGVDSSYERSLQKGVPDLFRVRLDTGQFLRVAVVQRALDVSVRLIGPDGTAIMSADTMNGFFGVERIAFIAPSAAEYRIEVSTGGTAPEGRYVLKVLALRPATPDDTRHAAAERVYGEAESLRVKNTADARAAAVAKYHEAAGTFLSLGLQYETAMSLFSSGIQQLTGGQARGAAADLAQALPIVRASNDPLLPSVVNALGGAYDILGEPARAMASYREALGFFRANKNQAGEANALNNIGKVYADLAEWQQALEYYRLAMPIWQAIHDARREGITLHNIGFAYYSAGDDERALEQFGQALDRRRAAADKGGEADTLSAIGLAETRRGNHREALAHFEQALSLRRAVGDRRSEGFTLDYIGRSHLENGEPQQAIGIFEQALALERASADRRNEGLTLGNLARANSLLGRHDVALERGRESLGILREIGDRNNTAGMLYVVARAERDLGKLADATAHAAEALKTIEDVRGDVASRQLRTAYFASQHDISMFYIDLLMRQHDREPARGYDIRAFEASERARARSLIELLAEGDSGGFRKGADPALLGRERDLSERLGLKTSRLLGLLARGSRTPEAEALSQEVRTLEAEYDDVQASLRKASPAYARLMQPQPLETSAIQRDLLDPRTTLLEYALGEDASYVWAVEQQRVRSFRLPPQAVIEQASREAYGDVTARGTSIAGETPAARDARIAHADEALPFALQRLSAIILAPVLPLTNNGRLIIVADGALNYLPFAMLPVTVGGTSAPLIARAEVVSLPSASTLAAQRAMLAGRLAATKTLAVFADPVFDSSDPRVSSSAAAATVSRPASEQTRLLLHLAPTTEGGRTVIPRLPFTATEASAILKAVGGTGALSATGFDARKGAVLGNRLEDYRYVHFATHGFIDADNPSLSALVLSLVDREGRPEDGFLRADELYALKLSADLVVLSACQTGLGKTIKGEGVIGLTRGLMYAGASKVVVSLWSVSDRATADLMSLMYKELVTAGKPPAAALRAAQLAMWRSPRGKAPYYWAAFVLQGDWK
jgi:CHAT domain-containing protein/tetratricopeptide (TPR) repeat protein